MIEIIEKKSDIDAFFAKLKERGNVSSGNYVDTVKEIIADVRENGDDALIKYTKKFDDPSFDESKLVITKDELKEAFMSLDEKTRNILLRAKKRIYEYHEHQLRQTFMYKDELGANLGLRFSPIAKVGIYVPGGKASYPSSVLMNALPAKVAGVKKLTMVTPAPGGEMNPMVLAAAYVCDIDNVYRIGGAQAIAALAYGTKTIEAVNKIVGPGNIFVALAKKEVYGTVGIDSIAGPSEICIVGDSTSNPKFLASDLLGQAEHDELASSTLFISDRRVAEETLEYVKKYYETSSRKKILDSSLTIYSKIVLVSSVDEAIEYANKVAPEHLELAIDDARSYLDKITDAGAIFMGHYSPEALGDYMAGPNHVLPTVGTARFFSPLGVDDFIKKSSLIEFDKESALALIDDVEAFALKEGLEMHALSAKVRGE